MKKALFSILALLFLNGCAESVALLGSSVGGASSGKILQSSLTSSISYGVKHKTGKSPLGHIVAYAEEKNPEKKKEKCISFIESTRSEFCTIAKKQLSSTNIALKKKVKEITSKHTKTDKIKNLILKKENNLKSINNTKKSPRMLAIAYQSKLKEEKK